MAYQFITYDQNEGVGRVVLNRPEQSNALNPAMLQELAEVFREISRDAKVRAVLLTGAGRNFCAGEDLRERATAELSAPTSNEPAFDAFAPNFSGQSERPGGAPYTPSAVSVQDGPQPLLSSEFVPLNPNPTPLQNPGNQTARMLQPTEVGRGGPLFDPSTSDITRGRGAASYSEQIRLFYTPLVTQIRQLEKPVIAVVNGVAAGTGLGLALACDIRYASDRARFVEVSIRVGLLPGGGTGYFLPRLIGLSKALELAFSGDQMEAVEAERLGLVNRVFPADKLLEESYKMALRLAKGPTRAIGLAKVMMYRSANLNLEQGLDMESELMEEATRTQDYREGLQAYLDKRTPNYRGQ